jgi:hypothetical protein
MGETSVTMPVGLPLPAFALLAASITHAEHGGPPPYSRGSLRHATAAAPANEPMACPLAR